MRIVLAIALLLVLPACTARLPLGHLMSWPEYGRTKHAVPYILEVKAKRGALLYFGAEHMTGQPDHAQVEQIEGLWREFRPSIVLNEGWDPPVVPDLREAVRLYGEPGLLRHLAARDGVPIDDMEPPEAGDWPDPQTP